LHTIDVNGTPNYNWHKARNIRETISKMSEHDKLHALDRINAELLLGNSPTDTKTLHYVQDLLNGQRPKNGIARKEVTSANTHPT